MKTLFSKKFWQTLGIINGLMALPFAALAQSTGSDNFGSGLQSIYSVFPHSGIAGANSFTSLTMLIISAMLFIAGMLAVVFVIIGGYQYMTSAGNEEQAEKGKQNVINAVIGIVIIILSYVIITVIANLVSGSSGY
jgi:uncharacterized BrkB/YihY/UPF0761 family membrane protein